MCYVLYVLYVKQMYVLYVLYVIYVLYVYQNIESIRYNAALAITGAIRRTSREKLYQELGFESLQQRRSYRKLCCLFKITNNRSPRYLF